MKLSINSGLVGSSFALADKTYPIMRKQQATPPLDKASPRQRRLFTADAAV
jgi:hypothetical protein